MTNISNPLKPWWQGDPRVEPFMNHIRESLERNNITGNAKTDIYNRAYEAVHEAICAYGGKKEQWK